MYNRIVSQDLNKNINKYCEMKLTKTQLHNAVIQKNILHNGITFQVVVPSKNWCGIGLGEKNH